MNLQTKSVLAFNVCIIFACVVMGLLGWFSANSGFDDALQVQASSNLKVMLDSIDARYPGEWHVENGVLYKGEHNMNEDQELTDRFGDTCHGFITFFAGDTRISTNVKDANGARNVGTKASDVVIETVLKQGKTQEGRAPVLGNDYMSSYAPLKNGSGQNIGIVFLGVDVRTMDGVRHSFMIASVIAILILVGVLSFISYILIGKAIRPLLSLTDALGQIAEGDLRIADLSEDRSDELGALAHSANGMKSRLKSVIKNVAASAESVAASSQELTANASRTPCRILQRRASR